MGIAFNRDLDAVSGAIIGAAIEVHRSLGPGLLENIYEQAFCHELSLRRIPFQRQQIAPVCYKGVHLKSELRYDVLVGGRVLVELKAKENLSPTDKPQLLSYLRLLDLRLGLLINFHTLCLKNGIHRIVNRLDEPLRPKELPKF